MEVLVNGERRTMREGTTISDLLADLRIGGRRIAVEINRDVLPAGEYVHRAIREGDQIEIVHFVGGG